MLSDIIGKRFGRLTVLAHEQHNIWLCECDCGQYCYARTGTLKSGEKKSCGCLRKETATEQALKNSKNKFTGRKRTNAGYIAIYKPDHPNANVTGYVLEHRLVMENTLGRYLQKNEIVHHINGNKKDNRPENLQLMTRSTHQSYHLAERNRARAGGAK